MVFCILYCRSSSRSLHLLQTCPLSALPRLQPVPRPPPLAGEDGWLAEAYETRYVRWGRVVGTAVLFAVSSPIQVLP